MDEWRRLTSGLRPRGTVSLGEIREVEEDLGTQLPADLVKFVCSNDAAEGFVGGAYLAMWPVKQLLSLNGVAQVRSFVPDLLIIGTDGGGEGYGYELTTGSYVDVPMIGMRPASVERIAPTFVEFLRWLVARYPAPAESPASHPARVGLVIHEIHPILFGGSPTDPSNKVLLPLEKYVELVAFWNHKAREVANQ